MSISCVHGVSPALACTICYIKDNNSEYEQLKEKANKDAIDSHNQKQEILKLQRIIARQNTEIGKLYQQVHGRPLIYNYDSKEKNSYKFSEPYPHIQDLLNKLNTTKMYADSSRGETPNHAPDPILSAAPRVRSGLGE